MVRCGQEMCPMWDGEGCPCDMFGLDPDDLPESGTYIIQWPSTETSEDE